MYDYSVFDRVGNTDDNKHELFENGFNLSLNKNEMVVSFITRL